MIIARRSLVLGTAAMLAAGWAVAGPTSLRLRPGDPPGGGGPDGSLEVDGKGAISNVAVPTLEVFVPSHPNGTAMLVAAGGGYKRIEIEREARPAARWLAEWGVTAFVLSYRLPREGWVNGPLAPPRMRNAPCA